MTEQHKQTAIVRARWVWKARQESLTNLTTAAIVTIPAFICVIQAHDAELDRLCRIDGVMDALLDDMAKELEVKQ